VRFLLDTNICIAAIRQHALVLGRMVRLPPDEMAVSVMTVAELWFGALKSKDPARGRALADAFLEPFARLPFDDAAAERYAATRLHLESRGAPIGERDLIIGAIGLTHGLTVVTNNVREFSRVPELKTVDWSKA
jgi:tRNA(fMet)-specific endonuclease VapC